MPGARPGLWAVTILIVLAGVVLLYRARGGDLLMRPTAELRGVPIGAPAADLGTEFAGGPVRCPGDSLDHLRDSFPEGWSPAAIDVAIDALEARTSQRWVYDVDGATAADCRPSPRRTEVGVTTDGFVLWFVPELGTSPIALPPSVTPSGVDDSAMREAVERAQQRTND